MFPAEGGFSRNVLALAVAAAFLNILPRLFFPPGGDVFVHYAAIECFSRQLWEGHLYPRWCIDSNAGLGGAFLLFYFPFSYYVTAIFYPLRHIGMTVDMVYLVSLLGAGTVTFITCWLWLSDVVGSRRALLAAFLFLWLPYRSELLYWRSAYAELWQLAFLPLFWLALRRLVTGRDMGWPCLAALMAVLLYTHFPVSLLALAAGGFYCMVLAPKKSMGVYAISLLLAAMLAALYIAPAKYFMTALDPVKLAQDGHIWANSFVNAESFVHQLPVVVYVPVAGCALAAMMVRIALGRRRIADGFVRREIMVWSVIACGAFFMLFPVSAPLWNLFSMVVGIAAAPWRLQGIVAFGGIYMAAVYMRWVLPPDRLKNWVYEYAVLVCVLVAICLSMMASRSGDEVSDRFLHARLTAFIQTRWMDAAHSPFSQLIEEDTHRGPNAELLEVVGSVAVSQWDDEGLRMETDSPGGGLLRLRQLYFPLWRATLDGQPVDIAAQAATGRMLLRVPPGRHRIALRADIARSMPYYSMAGAVSALGLCIVGVGLYRRKRHCFSMEATKKL